MSEIKGIDQIFPKKAEDSSGASGLKLWAVAGIVAALAAGYAFLPTGSTPMVPQQQQQTYSVPVAATPVPERPAATATETVVKKAKPVSVAVEDIKSARKQEAKRQQKTEVSQNITAPEVKAATKALGGRSCDCETAELNLPAQCPDASCRQCKATCGIPGN